MKTVTEMSVSELLNADRHVGNKLDAMDELAPEMITGFLVSRREIRAELSRRRLALDMTKSELIKTGDCLSR